MILGVSGTRAGMSDEQWLVARGLFSAEKMAELDIVTLHSGDCVGVDDQCLRMMVGDGFVGDIHLYPALVSDRWRARGLAWLTEMNYPGYVTQYMPLHPLYRNGLIAQACDELWAFPGSDGGGTWDTIRKARRLGRLGWIIHPDGRLEALL